MRMRRLYLCLKKPKPLPPEEHVKWLAVGAGVILAFIIGAYIVEKRAGLRPVR